MRIICQVVRGDIMAEPHKGKMQKMGVYLIALSQK